MASLLLSVAARGAGLGASSMGGAVSSAFSSVAGSCLGQLKDCLVCPHPTECGCIGAVSFCMGCQDHKRFNMIIEVHEFDRLQKGSTIYLEVEVGRLRVVTRDVSAVGSSASLEERLFVKVRQVDNIIQLRLIKKGILKTEVIAEYGLRVKQDLIDKRFPKKEWITMNAVKGVSNVKILISCYYMDPALPAAQSPLVQQAILLAQQEAEERKQPLNLDLSALGEKERLVFFSKVLEGPLQKMASAGGAWTDLYFKAVESSKDKWEWFCWTSRHACYSDAPAVARYGLLAISLVLPDKSDKDVFYVRYHEKYEQHDLFFKRVDRSRDLWSDGLFEFIDKLRAYLDLCATAGDETRYKLNSDEKQQKKARRRASAAAPDKPTTKDGPISKDARCLASPRVNTVASARRPSSANALIENLMYSVETNTGSTAHETSRAETPEE